MAETLWHEFETYALNRDSLHGRFFIPLESVWFDGHFPEDPVLPGVSMLGMLKELVEKAVPGTRITGFRRVRFRRIVHGGASLSIRVAGSQGGGNLYSFDIMEEGSIISSGLLETDRPLGISGVS